MVSLQRNRDVVSLEVLSFESQESLRTRSSDLGTIADDGLLHKGPSLWQGHREYTNGPAKIGMEWSITACELEIPMSWTALAERELLTDV